MSEFSSKTVREARKTRLSKLLRVDPKGRVDASGYTPPDALDADVKTGLRPVSRRQFRRGGKVFANEGIKTMPRADKKHRPSASGFGAESKPKAPDYGREVYASGGLAGQFENRDVREINRSRTGSKHVGGFAAGGSVNLSSLYGSKPMPRTLNDAQRDFSSMKRSGQVSDRHRPAFMEAIQQHLGDKVKMSSFARGGSTWPTGDEAPSLRLVRSFKGPKGHVTKVYRDRDWDEYRVKHFTPDGKHQKDADYHTSDKDDALSTAEHVVQKGFARGGSAHSDRVEDVKLIREKVKPSALKYSGGPVDYGAVQRAMKASQRAGVDPMNTHDVQKKAYHKAALDKARRLAEREARTAHAGGGPAGKPTRDVPVYNADTDGGGRRQALRRAAGGSTNDAPEDNYGSPHNDETANRTSTGTPGYSRVAVDKAIESSNRSGRRIGKGEASRIHALLRGRHARGGVAGIYKLGDTAEPRQARMKNPEITHNPEQPFEAPGYATRGKAIRAQTDGGRQLRKRGGAVNIADLDGTMPTGGREARARGGRTKGKTNINIIIAAPKGAPAMPVGAPMVPPGGAPPGGPGMHQGAPPAAPPGMPPAAPPGAAPPMARRTGGRVAGSHMIANGLGFDRKTAKGPGAPGVPMTTAGGGGLGRREKMQYYGKQARAK